MTIFESDLYSIFPMLESSEWLQMRELREQVIACMYGWA